MSALKVENLNKSFGALAVTRDVTLTVEVGQRHALIGPNGAGKTSLINLMSGFLMPDSGTVTLKGQDVTSRMPYERCQMGLARTFQKNSLFENLTVFENVRLAVQSRRGHSLNFAVPVSSLSGLRLAAERMLDAVRLHDRRNELVSSLSYGEQRQLEIALALATEPDVILLDEPTSGMSRAETGEMITLVAGLPRHIAIVLVEHDMHVVHSLADVVTVLHHGSLLVSGSPQDVSQNEEVRKVYLGTGLTSESVHA